MLKIRTLLLGALMFSTPSAAHAQTVEAAPEVQPVVAPQIAPAVQPTVAPQVAPTVQPAVGPQVAPAVQPTIAPQVAPAGQPTVAPEIAPAVTIAPEAQLPFSNSGFEAGFSRPWIMPVIILPLPGQTRA